MMVSDKLEENMKKRTVAILPAILFLAFARLWVTQIALGSPPSQGPTQTPTPEDHEAHHPGGTEVWRKFGVVTCEDIETAIQAALR
jgi:hypothetical protein